MPWPSRSSATQRMSSRLERAETMSKPTRRRRISIVAGAGSAVPASDIVETVRSGRADHGEELPPRVRIGAEGAEHAARHHGDAGLVHAARRHALMRRLDDD